MEVRGLQLCPKIAHKLLNNRSVIQLVKVVYVHKRGVGMRDLGIVDLKS